MTFASATQPILWEVAEEHLDEAQFCLEQFERSVESPTRTLSEIASYPEQRLIAHLDALIVGGATVRDTLLAPVVDEPAPDEPARIAAVAIILVATESYALLAGLLSHEDDRVRNAAVRGALLAGRAGLDAWISRSLTRTSSTELRASLLTLVAGRRLTTPSLMDVLQSEDARLTCAAALAAAHGERSLYLPIMEDLLKHASPVVREAAIVACLGWDSPYAWSACQELAFGSAPPDALAVSLVAALGGRAHHQQLVARLGMSTHRLSILFALGFTGNAALVPVLLAHVRAKDPLEAKIAAQSLAIITGVDVCEADTSAASTPATVQLATDGDGDGDDLPPLEEDLDIDLVPAPEEELPPPDAAALEKLLGSRERALDERTRLIAGLPYSSESVVRYLTSAPMRPRHVVALALRIRSGGTATLDTRALTRAQNAQLSHLRTVQLPGRSPVSW